MQHRQLVISAILAAGWVGLLAVVPGCGDLGRNLTAETTGNVSILVINNTSFRAIFTVMSWDSWDRTTPGPVGQTQQTLEAGETSSALTLPCRRNLAIGTQEPIDRILEIGLDNFGNLDVDLLDADVRFSSAPAGSDGENLPTAGTAAGREVLVGVDYSCADQLIFSLVEDPAAPGGFRVDYTVILDEIDD
jgi:hypothetical protein